MKNINEKLDQIFSINVRLKAVNDYGHTNCPLCGKPMNYHGLVLGHMIRRRHERFRWSFVNCDAICPGCNAKEEYQLNEPMRDYKISTLGPEIVEQMERDIHKPFKMTNWDKETLFKQLKAECKILLKDKMFEVKLP
jgi:hypothetical protein